MFRKATNKKNNSYIFPCLLTLTQSNRIIFRVRFCPALPLMARQHILTLGEFMNLKLNLSPVKATGVARQLVSPDGDHL